MAEWVEDLAGRYGQVETVVRVGTAIHERTDDLLVGQWLMRSMLKSVELAHSLAEDFYSQRFVSAQVMTRALLETAATLAWATDEPDESARIRRIHRALMTSYRARVRKGATLPVRERSFLKAAEEGGLKGLPDVRGMLDQLDRAEAARPDGIPHWGSHYAQFGLSSDFLHDPFVGVGVFAIDAEADMMEIDLNPDARAGLIALRWGGFYLVRCLDAVAQAADLAEDRRLIAEKYRVFQPTAQTALKDVTD
jgi:hypothetical protein